MFEVMRQICNLIPSLLVSQIAKQTGVDQKARKFTPWSHVVSMLYAQLTHAIGLNDVCDALKLFRRLFRARLCAGASFRLGFAFPLPRELVLPTPHFRHNRRSRWPAMMMFEFHKLVICIVGWTTERQRRSPKPSNVRAEAKPLLSMD
jgi:hypothetical protein